MIASDGHRAQSVDILQLAPTIPEGKGCLSILNPFKPHPELGLSVISPLSLLLLLLPIPTLTLPFSIFFLFPSLDLFLFSFFLFSCLLLSL